MAGVQDSAQAFAVCRAGRLGSLAEAHGSADFSPLCSGQNASGCKACSAMELTRALAGC